MERFSTRKPYRGPITGAVFDVAGTVLDHGSMAPVSAFVSVFRERGVEITADEARGPMGIAKKDHIRVLTETESVAGRWEAVHGRRPTEADVDAMYDGFVPVQTECLGRHVDLIPGVVDAVARLRAQGVRIGVSTGFTQAMLHFLLDRVAAEGFVPDAAIAPDRVPAGRPYPWMCFQLAIDMQTYPLASMVKFGDTIADVEAGVNAGMWTVGVSQTGNLLGLTREQVDALSPGELADRLAPITEKLAAAGAHYVIAGVWDAPRVIDDINARLAAGEHP